jgi:hypothetical protein
MLNLFVYDYARAYLEELARKAQQARLADRALGERRRTDGGPTGR